MFAPEDSSIADVVVIVVEDHSHTAAVGEALMIELPRNRLVYGDAAANGVVDSACSPRVPTLHRHESSKDIGSCWSGQSHGTAQTPADEQ